jgi:hypothetical protein
MQLRRWARPFNLQTGRRYARRARVCVCCTPLTSTRAVCVVSALFVFAVCTPAQAQERLIGYTQYLVQPPDRVIETLDEWMSAQVPCVHVLSCVPPLCVTCVSHVCHMCAPCVSRCSASCTSLVRHCLILKKKRMFRLLCAPSAVPHGYLLCLCRVLSLTHSVVPPPPPYVPLVLSAG